MCPNLPSKISEKYTFVNQSKNFYVFKFLISKKYIGIYIFNNAYDKFRFFWNLKIRVDKLTHSSSYFLSVKLQYFVKMTKKIQLLITDKEILS